MQRSSFELPAEGAGPSHGGPSILFGALEEDKMSLAASTVAAKLESEAELTPAPTDRQEHWTPLSARGWMISIWALLAPPFLWLVYVRLVFFQ